MNKKKIRIYTVKLATINKKEYLELLQKLDITKMQLSKDMGIAYSTVKSWYVRDRIMPMYSQRYLETAVELKNYKDNYHNIELLKLSLNKLKI